ncbi:MAG TPA: cisplatin damage response ATP-dependent DNA ligase [Xanthobacteraceae bacterium]|nr:cisplatin damage response ATP-dependent DNA ligase [Xanthobacteraceae bacterium]
MNRFADLLDRLAYEPGRNAKLRLMTDYFAQTPDPDRGWALAALTGALSFRHAKPGVIRALITERADPVLFGMSYDYVGDLSETVALMWPAKQNAVGAPRPRAGEGKESAPSLTSVVTTLASLGKTELPQQIARWLDELDETGRWALLKLVTGALRIGVSARLAKTAVAALGDKTADEIELIWPTLAPPYVELFAWVEGRADKPAATHPTPFRPVMLSHAIEPADFAALAPADFSAEWKWDGIRVQAVAAPRGDERFETRLYSRTGEDISAAFPDLAEALRIDAAIDGELLIMREGRIQSFNVLQQRLNRKAVTAQLMADFPAHLRAYDLLVEGEEDLREQPFATRRARLEALLTRLATPCIDLSPLVPFATWDDLTRARADPAAAGAGPDAEAVEGVMLKRRDAPYVPGRPRGLWWKWKRDPFVVDAVLMYAQRGHGKRSSFYSDYTFGVWSAAPDADGAELVPVGKAYFGFTDAELAEIDRFVRRNTVNRFGPVREIVHERDHGLVFEVAFEGLARSTRHKSGLAMRFPRISRLRWDKQPADADLIETLERLLAASAARE